MWQRNKGQSEDEILQNQFTSYLSLAVQRQRREYIRQMDRRLAEETDLEELNYIHDGIIEADFIYSLPLLMQLESSSLFYALRKLNERERMVFLAHILDEKSFSELSGELGISYKGVAAVYYRALDKIRRSMEETKNGI